MSRRPFVVVFSSVLQSFLQTVSALSKYQIRNQKRKHARQLQSIHSTIQKNHIARIEKELVVSNDVLKKTAGELASVKNANDRLQVIAQSATLDAHIFKRSAENHATKLVEKDRIISSLSAVAATARKSPP